MSGKPSIVFAHGLWADGSCFAKVIQPLIADGYGHRRTSEVRPATVRSRLESGPLLRAQPRQLRASFRHGKELRI